MDKNDLYFAIGTTLAILALLGMDWKLVWGLYHGLGPVSFVQANFKGQVWLGSDNIAIQNFGIADAELNKMGTMIQLHRWVQMDKNGNPISVQ